MADNAHSFVNSDMSGINSTLSVSQAPRETYYNELRNDDFFESFFVSDADVTQLTTDALQQGSDIATVLGKLKEGIFLLDKDLRSQVATDHDSLLSQATGIETLESALQMMQTRLKALTVAVDRIGECVSEPYKVLHTRIRQLERIQATCDLLRRIQRITSITNKLRAIQGSQDQMVKVAQSVNELNYLISGFDWSGIEVLQDERIMIKDAEARVKATAKETLLECIEAENHTFVGNSLQALHHLGCLKETISEYLDTVDNAVKKKLHAALSGASVLAAPGVATAGSKGKKGSSSALSDSSTTSSRNASQLASLWTGVDSSMEALAGYAQRVLHVQKSLARRRDMSTGGASQIPLVSAGVDDTSAVGGGEEKSSWEGTVLASFWERMCVDIDASLAATVRKSAFVRDTLAGSFPRLLRAVNALYVRVSSSPGADAVQGLRFTDGKKQQQQQEDLRKLTSAAGSTGKDSKLTDKDAYEQLRKTVASFERDYLANSLRVLFEAIKITFHQIYATGPSGISKSASSGSSLFAAGQSLSGETKTNEIDQLHATVTRHLDAVAFDSQLSIAVASNVCRCVEMYCAEREGSVSLASQPSQLMAAPGDGQRRNAAVANDLWVLRGLVMRIVSEASGIVSSATTNSMGDMSTGSLAGGESSLNAQTRTGGHLLMPPDGIIRITAATESIDQLMRTATQPLISAVSTAFADVIATIHDENFVDYDDSDVKGQGSDGGAGSLSHFTRELESVSERVFSDFRSLFSCEEFMAERFTSVFTDTVDMFLRHASAVRPLGAGGRRRLAADAVRLEEALTPLCGRDASGQRACRRLRAVRAFLLRPWEDVSSMESASKDAVSAGISPSCIAMFLFSLGPAELKSPLEGMGKSGREFVDWFEGRSGGEKERLGVIEGSLDVYVKSVASRSGLEYAPVYPTLRGLIKRGPLGYSGRK